MFGYFCIGKGRETKGREQGKKEGKGREEEKKGREGKKGKMERKREGKR